MIKQILPTTVKNKIKTRIMQIFHLVPARDLEIANCVIENGLDNYLKYNFLDEKQRILEHLDLLELSPYVYKYASSRTAPVLYASIYSCMLKAIYGELDDLTTKEKRSWADYFDSFQSKDDGYFRDPLLEGKEFEGDCGWGDGWGIQHLAGHIIIAYGRLGFKPKYKFIFLEKYYDLVYLENWLNQLFEEKPMWGASNYIMNVCTLLQYSRDFMYDKKAHESIQFILNWLSNLQNPETGMWHKGKLNSYKELSDAIRGAYHYFPLYIYEKKPIKYQEKVVDHILKSQNSWGGFEDEMKPSGACEDIDALDPLIRFTLNTNYRKGEVDLAIRKCLVWIFSNKTKDGGFSFMSKTPHEYGNHILTSSNKDEGNLFASWFRTLALAYALEYLEIENKFNIGWFPGYELKIR